MKANNAPTAAPAEVWADPSPLRDSVHLRIGIGGGPIMTLVLEPEVARNLICQLAHSVEEIEPSRPWGIQQQERTDGKPNA